MTLHVKHIYGEVGRDICLTRLSLEKMLIDREANKSWISLTLFNQNFVLINQFQKLVKDKAWKQIPQMLLSSETSSSYETSSFPFSFELELFTTLVTSKMAMSFQYEKRSCTFSSVPPAPFPTAININWVVNVYYFISFPMCSFQVNPSSYVRPYCKIIPLLLMIHIWLAV